MKPLLSLLLAFVAAAAAADDVHLILPADRASAAAGSTVPIAWDAANLPDGVVEWEAFVSIDGGRTYPMRITPHLDANIRRFAWTVPYLPGAELSILLRIGNEREERRVSFPARVRIRGALPLEMFRLAPRGTAGARNEDHGETLVEWIDGSRDGSDLHRVAVDSSRLDRGEVRTQTHESDPAAATSDAPGIERTPKGSMYRGLDESTRVDRTPRRGAAGILTLTHRLNA